MKTLLLWAAAVLLISCKKINVEQQPEPLKTHPIYGTWKILLNPNHATLTFQQNNEVWAYGDFSGSTKQAKDFKIDSSVTYKTKAGDCIKLTFIQDDPAQNTSFYLWHYPDWKHIKFVADTTMHYPDDWEDLLKQ